MKVCTKCKTLKTDFPSNNRMADGLSSWCNDCHKQRRRDDYMRDPEKYKVAQREYARKNPEKVAAYHRRYYKENRERVREYKQEWAKRNRVRIKNKFSLYYKRHRRKIRARSALWRKNNRGRALENMKDNQLRVLYGVNREWLKNAIKIQRYMCALCGCKEPGGSGTWNVDHDHESMVIRGILCSRCNRGLGYFEDDLCIVLLALKYLKFADTGMVSIGKQGGGPTRAYRLKSAHGITIDQFNKLFKRQWRRCGICRKKNPVKVQSSVWKIDHDHRTMKIRGILCGKCNLWLGFFRDNVESLRKAIGYLNSKGSHLRCVDG